MRKNFFLALCLTGLLLAACGGGAAPTPSAPTPAAVPTQPLTPTGLPAGGFPLIDTPLEGQIVYSNGDGYI